MARTAIDNVVDLISDAMHRRPEGWTAQQRARWTEEERLERMAEEARWDDHCRAMTPRER